MMPPTLRERLKHIPQPDYEWRSETIQPPPEVSSSDIKVRLDGFFMAGYAEAYMAAWQALMPRATELAIPILYLQRHTLELLVKDGIQSLVAIRDEMQLGHEVLGLTAPDGLETEARKLKGHDFKPLFKCLSRNLEILKLPELPEEYRQARELLEVIEQEDTTRLRYETLNSGHASFSHSPNKPKVAHIGRISKLLTTIATVHELVGDDPHEIPDSFMGLIVKRAISVHDDIQSALGRLEKSTEKDEVVWRLTPTPAIPDGHRNIDALKEALTRCLATEFEGRQLVILKVPRYGDYPHVLSCLDEGKLSRLIWPPPYSSNVVNAAIDSRKRHDPDEASPDTPTEVVS